MYDIGKRMRTRLSPPYPHWFVGVLSHFNYHYSQKCGEKVLKGMDIPILQEFLPLSENDSVHGFWAYAPNMSKNAIKYTAVCRLQTAD
jgi:hypothetical protein